MKRKFFQSKMEEQQNKNNPIPSVQANQTGNTENLDEEKELLKDSQILIKNQSGKFEYLNGNSLLDQQGVASSAPAFTPEIKGAIKQVTASQVHSPLLDLKKPSDKLTASYYIDAEDEAEIQKIYDNKIGKAASVIDYDLLVEEIKKICRISYPDEMLDKRFTSLINSRLRDIRTSYQLKELLTRSKKVGGLELPLEQADEIIKVTEEKAKSLHDRKTIQELAERKKKKEQEVQKEADEQARIRQAIAREQIKKALVAMQQKPPSPPPIAPQPVTPPPPKIIKKRAAFPEIPQVTRPSLDLETRAKIVDIRTPKKLLGPVEEIKSTSLEDFRRLGSTADEAIKKIKEKVDLLEEESFTRKAEGIQAWRQSEIYQLYLDIGNESMNKGESIEEVIRSRTTEGRSCLTSEEFRAVGELNKRLRF